VSFDAFVDAAWTDHADDAAGVASRLESSLALVDAPARVTPYARLATHVFGEHLGEWGRGARLLAHLRERARGDEAAARAVERGIATLGYAGGDPKALEALAADDRIAALAAASSAFAGRRDFARAIETYDDAVAKAAAGLPDGSPAIRALAVGGNNLAAALECEAALTELEATKMIAAAELGLKYWTLAGTWLEQERALSRLSCSLRRAGRAREAVEAAKRCLAVCEANDAPAFERFFGTAALARAQRDMGDRAACERSRDAARAHFDRLADDERSACEDELRALDDR